jgi:hypothetical protein
MAAAANWRGSARQVIAIHLLPDPDSSPTARLLDANGLALGSPGVAIEAQWPNAAPPAITALVMLESRCRCEIVAAAAVQRAPAAVDQGFADRKRRLNAAVLGQLAV